jgi:hypothetical protein
LYLASNFAVSSFLVVHPCRYRARPDVNRTAWTAPQPRLKLGVKDGGSVMIGGGTLAESSCDRVVVAAGSRATDNADCGIPGASSDDASSAGQLGCPTIRELGEGNDASAGGAVVLRTTRWGATVDSRTAMSPPSSRAIARSTAKDVICPTS